MNWYLVVKFLHILAVIINIGGMFARQLVIMIGLIPGVFIPHNKKVDSILRTALTEGRVTPELTSALNDSKNKWAHHAQEIIVLVIAALMVLKPF